MKERGRFINITGVLIVEEGGRGTSLLKYPCYSDLKTEFIYMVPTWIPRLYGNATLSSKINVRPVYKFFENKSNFIRNFLKKW